MEIDQRVVKGHSFALRIFQKKKAKRQRKNLHLVELKVFCSNTDILKYLSLRNYFWPLESLGKGAFPF